MKALVQRVDDAKVSVGGTITGSIGKGLLIFLCAVKGDTTEDIDYLTRKIPGLRIFDDEQGKMNLSLLDIGGEALVISQFTLAAETRKGNRPSFGNAESPDKAKKTYDSFVIKLRNTGISVVSGTFGADMLVSLINQGPVTIMIDSRDEKG